MGVLHYLLGIEIYQNEEGVFICQRKYAKTLIEKFKMKDCKLVVTALIVNENLSKEDGSNEVDASIYKSLVESLLYLMATRPKIIFPTSTFDSCTNQAKHTWDTFKVHLILIFCMRRMLM